MAYNVTKMEAWEPVAAVGSERMRTVGEDGWVALRSVVEEE